MCNTPSSTASGSITSLVDDFIDGLTPSNYYLTKSMEMSKINTSGTLWYLKKFLVLYDAIFLSKSIRTQAGVTSIVRNFNKYINSLPNDIQDDAIAFFFPPEANLAGSYKTYNQFAGTPQLFEDDDAKNSFYALVDKYYFVYLMNIGGQSGVKAFLREEVYSKDFDMTQLDRLIEEWLNNNPECTNGLIQIRNDYHAALRNERQILFYYGFVHSRSTGASCDHEFCSLTPIGELAVQANSKEFAIIYEHQKLKMVSQPVTITFPSITSGRSSCNHQKFLINYSPYLSILKCLEANSEIDSNFYDHVLSRSNTNNWQTLIDNYNLFLSKDEEIKTAIANFNVQSDVRGEDFDKEIKKYLLGVRSDLVKDNGENYYGLCAYKSGKGWELKNASRLSQILRIYSEIDAYKIARYKELFDECASELQRKYKALYTEDSSYSFNYKIKLRWDLYNIHEDKTIMLSLMINDFCLRNNKVLESINATQIVDDLLTNFPIILKRLSLDKKSPLRDMIKIIISALVNSTLRDIYLDDIYGQKVPPVVTKYYSVNPTDLVSRIQKISEVDSSVQIEHKRDMRLIGLMEAYYRGSFVDEHNLITCDCCGQTTFPDKKGYAYLEFHHLIPFSIANGPDHYENIFGICPMCHRKIHNGNDSIKEDLYDGFDTNNHMGINLINRLKDLYSKKFLKSYQLEYALAEQMINENEYNMILA